METTRADEIYTTILGLAIELEEDPTVLGPRYLQKVTAQCRNYLNQVMLILLQIQREKRAVTRQLSGAEAEKQVLADQLLVENDVIKRLPNIKDREAQINVYLATQVDRINVLRREILDLDTIEKAVRLRHQELVRTSDNIKTQRSLLHADRVSGGGYGDESSDESRDSKGRLMPRADDLDENEIDRLLREEGQKAEAPSPVEEPKEEAPVEAPIPVEEPKAETPVLVEAPKVEEPSVIDLHALAPVSLIALPKTEVPSPVEEPKAEVPEEPAPKAKGPMDLFAELLAETTPPAEPVQVETAPASEVKPVVVEELVVVAATSEPEPVVQAAQETPVEKKVEGSKIAAEPDPLEAAMAGDPTEAQVQEFLAEATPAATPAVEEKSTAKKTKVKPATPPANDDLEFDFSDLLKSM